MDPSPQASRARLAILQPGTTWPTKHWALERFAAVGRSLATEFGFLPVVTWGPGEQVMASRLVHLMEGLGVLAPPTTIRQLAALLRRSHLYVGTDSGPMHLASVLGLPTVALFGPSNATHFAPYQGRTVVVRHALPCSPCEKATCRYDTTECMSSVTVADVLEAIRAATRRAPASEGAPCRRDPSVHEAPASGIGCGSSSR